MKRPWPWKAAALVFFVGIGLLVVSHFGRSWVGWMIFLRRGGYWGGASDANVTHGSR